MSKSDNESSRMITSYISLDCLAIRVRLSRPFLRGLAKCGKIPYLSDAGRMRFNEAAVHDALRIEAIRVSKINAGNAGLGS